MEWGDYKRLAADASGQNCPVRRTLDLMQGKWTLYVIFELSKADVLRFGALKKKLPGITNTMLTSTLRFFGGARAGDTGPVQRDPAPRGIFPVGSRKSAVSDLRGDGKLGGANILDEGRTAR